jgi:membrane protease YdiL (CAAX protease family)
MKMKTIIKRHPILFYVLVTFAISWLGAFILIAPNLLSGRAIPKMKGLLMFPILLFGPFLAGLMLEGISRGKEGLKDLLMRMVNWRLPIRWYAIILLVPPTLIMLVLLFLSNFLSPVFKPNFFPIGILFGIPAGIFEEIGWTGCALPKLLAQYSKAKAGIILGVIWGIWHFPVIDFLGTATPHGRYLFFFFLAFILLLTAMRILMTLVYTNTGSVFAIQIMHIVSTGCLVMFGPNGVSSKQEVQWYSIYAGILFVFTFLAYTWTGQKKSLSATENMLNITHR